ncbi:MAG: response regulator [Verrucomicrobiales bacterium]|nr:response regulator [Verrucomicrobiales bacterium]
MSHSQPEEIVSLAEQSVPPGQAGVVIEVLRTLVVEPDLNAGAVLASLAGARGHEVAQVTGCAEARAVLRETPPDFILLRLNHDTASAVADLLVEISANSGGAQPHVIALTDDDEPSNRIEAWLTRGFDDFITFYDQQSSAVVRNRFAIAEAALLRRRARQRAEAADAAAARRYEESFFRSPDAALVVTERDGFITEANPAAEQLLGLPRQDLVQRYLSLVLPDLFDHEDYDPRLLAVQDTVRLTEVSYTRPDRTRRFLDVFLTKIPWPPGSALLLQMHDLTLLKQREQHRLLEARQEASGRILLGVAREMSDALTSVRGNLDLLARQPQVRQETRELLAGAEAGCGHAEEVTRRLAQLGRQQQGMAIKKRPLHLKPLLEKVVPFALLNGKSRPVIHVGDDLWPVEADEPLLADALRRLTENADQAMPEGGSLFVDARNIRERRGENHEAAGVSIRLRDQGTGISPENQVRVFDPFYSTTGREGTGLSFAAAAVHAHGGRILLESVPGEGTTISVWLPVNIKMILAGGGSVPTSADLPPLAPAAAEVRARILFMDDDDQVRTLVRKILGAHGFDIYCTRDGQEAIDAFRKAHQFGAPFDVVLMDLDVRGGMGGMEAVARLRAEFPSLKALLTTGYIDDALLDSHRDHGFLGVIPKPFQVERLVGVLSKLVGVQV